MNQLNFFNSESQRRACVPKDEGCRRRDKGIRKAVQHAQEVCGDDWQVKALDFLYLYARNHHRFSGEMVRQESKGFVPEPPHARAWGAVMLGGVKRGWIRQIDYIKVVNPKAHRANAALWESVLVK